MGIEDRGNNLVGSLPPTRLDSLKSLRNLDLSNNKGLRGTIPNFKLYNLEKIDLSSDSLSGTIPNFNLPKLGGLYLNQNTRQQLTRFDTPKQMRKALTVFLQNKRTNFSTTSP